jgi:hypothetical protein
MVEACGGDMTSEGSVPYGPHEPPRPPALRRGQSEVPVPPSAGLLELALALGCSYLSLEESVAELRRAAGVEDLEVVRELLAPLERTATAGAEEAGRLVEAALPSRAEHVVAFYEDEGFLEASVGQFALTGLQRGETVLVVATPDHRQRFEAALAAAGHDVGGSRRAGRYVDLDAEDTLATLVVDGVLDVERFRRDVGDWLARATAGGRKVRVYGEMVAMLWGRGQLGVALELEDRWNELIAQTPFPVLCGYPLQAFDSEVTSDQFHAICQRHTGVTTESYAPLAASDDRRALVVLERDAEGGRPSSRRRR